MSNLRKSERHSCLVPVDGKDGSVFEQTQTIDFSREGLGFVSKRRIPINKEIPIEIDLAVEGKSVFVIGKVQWVCRIANSKNYRIGVTFKDVMQGSKSRLRKYFADKG